MYKIVKYYQVFTLPWWGYPKGWIQWPDKCWGPDPWTGWKRLPIARCIPDSQT